jgi:predicted glutamine amidotransferase
VCRFAFYLGSPIRISALVTEPENSIIHQSYMAQERVEPLNGDGFGLGWYVDGIEHPAAFRSITPAWNNRNLQALARAIESGCILAHVRAATSGLDVMEQNCHPFTHGPYAFMHNGEVGGFRRIRRALLESLSDEAFATVAGTTDSEHLFAVFRDELALREAEADRTEAMAGALEAAVGRVLALVERHAPGTPSYLNIVVTDGAAAVATRFTTAEGAAHTLRLNRARRYGMRGRVSQVIPRERSDEPAHAVLISSERLSDDPGWETVPTGSLVLVRPDLSVELRRLSVN